MKQTLGLGIFGLVLVSLVAIVYKALVDEGLSVDDDTIIPLGSVRS